MQFLNQSAFLKALGWALLNSFWQFGVLWLVFVIISSAKKKLSAESRHGLSLLLVTIGFLWSGLSLCYEYFAFSESVSSGYAFYEGLSSAFFLPGKQLLDNSLSYLSILYLLIVAALFFKFFRYFYFSHKIQTQGLSKIKAELRLYVEQVALHLGIKRKVSIFLSQCVDTPIIVGFLKPTILVPFACMNQLSTQQLEAVLLHELAHIKRNDYMMNLFVAVTEIIFFFNPFAGLLIKLIKQERENSCDDHVLQFRFDRHQYASALLALEKNRLTYFPLTLASNGTGKRTLLHRIERILQVQRSVEQGNSMKFLAYLVSIALLGFIAFINPGDVMIKKMAVSFPPAQSLQVASREISPVISNHPLVVKKIISKKPFLNNNPDLYSRHANMEALIHEEAALDNNMLTINVAELAMEGLHQANRLVSAIQTESREFSKQDMEQPTPPEITTVEAFPFVPSSSFSYLFVDTTKPKVKKESYYERNARESLIKAKKAVAQIDWQKLEKDLNHKIDAEKLKKEIEKCLEAMNWQEINEEVRNDFAKENENLAKSLQEEAMQVSVYKAKQYQLQLVEKKLEEQKELNQRIYERQNLQLDKQLREEKKLKRKVIVYI